MFIHANTHEQMTLPPLDAPRVAHEDVMTSVCLDNGQTADDDEFSHTFR